MKKNFQNTYPDVPQVLSLLRQSQGFNLWIAQQQGAISALLPWLHSPWSSALVPAPPLFVGHPQESAPRPGEKGQGKWLPGVLGAPTLAE